MILRCSSCAFVASEAEECVGTLYTVAENARVVRRSGFNSKTPADTTCRV